jgi:hypothetical protein
MPGPQIPTKSTHYPQLEYTDSSRLICPPKRWGSLSRNCQGSTFDAESTSSREIPPSGGEMFPQTRGRRVFGDRHQSNVFRRPTSGQLVLAGFRWIVLRPSTFCGSTTSPKTNSVKHATRNKNHAARNIYRLPHTTFSLTEAALSKQVGSLVGDIVRIGFAL